MGDHVPMLRVLLTGMSGVGKSTQVHLLRELGYKAVDVDEPGWSEYVDCDGGGPSPQEPDKDWVWREDRVAELLATDDVDVLFLSGSATNQVKFHQQFDHIILLSAPVDVTVERLTTRTNNPYGKDAGELAQALFNKETVEPILRRIASAEIDTSPPAEDVTATILRLVAC